MGKPSLQLSRRRQDRRDNGDDTSNRGKRRKTATEAEEYGGVSALPRLPLSEVVLDCTKRWFQETLRLAIAGDVNMQVLLAQMYCSSYGIAKDANKGKFWLTRASKVMHSVWKVGNKRPGYSASDSDSDELADDS